MSSGAGHAGSAMGSASPRTGIPLAEHWPNKPNGGSSAVCHTCMLKGHCDMRQSETNASRINLFCAVALAAPTAVDVSHD